MEVKSWGGSGGEHGLDHVAYLGGRKDKDAQRHQVMKSDGAAVLCFAATGSDDTSEAQRRSAKTD